MDKNRSKKTNKTIAIIIVGLAALLILGQFGYFSMVKLFPDLVSDQKGIASNLANKILEAQSKYHDQNGKYAKDLNSLASISPRGEKYRIGYSSDFSKEIGSLCADCTYQEQAYKLLIVIKWLNGATVWSLDSAGGIKQLESIHVFPKEF